jgi:hypothetical protein
MKPYSEIKGWSAGRVHRTREHFELRYCFAYDEDPSKWILVALVGPAVAGIVKVEFLAKPGDPSRANAVSEAAIEIQYYLIDLGERCSWEYAKYHCGTSANLYSTVHWSYHRPEGPVPRPKKS